MDVQIIGHEHCQHCVVVPCTSLTRDTKVLDAVWALHRKRRIATRLLYKHKAWLNMHGGQQEHVIYYWDTYVPVVMWPTL